MGSVQVAEGLCRGKKQKKKEGIEEVKKGEKG